MVSQHPSVVGKIAQSMKWNMISAIAGPLGSPAVTVIPRPHLELAPIRQLGCDFTHLRTA